MGAFGGAFGLIFSFRRGLGSEHFEMLENEDPLIEIAVFSRPQGLQEAEKISQKAPPKTFKTPPKPTRSSPGKAESSP